jgi:hypothetical protein
MNTINFVDVSRDRLYWDRFQYVINFHLPWAGKLRGLFKPRWSNYRPDYLRLAGPRDTQNIRNVQAVVDLLLSHKDQYRSVITCDWLSVYTSDIELMNQLIPLIPATGNRPGFHRCAITRDRDVVVLNQTQHQYRTYFNSVSLDRAEKERLLKFVNNRGDYFRITNGFRRRLESEFSWCNLTRSNFLDHHDANDALMLSLVLPGVVRMTVPIQTK